MICLGVGLGAEARADEPQVREILNRTGETYRELKSCRFITLKKYELVRNSKVVMGEDRISLAMVKPGQYRLEMKDPLKEVLLVSDGETTWTYLPKTKSYTKQQVSFSDDERQLEDQGDDTDVLTTSRKSLVGIYTGLVRYADSARLLKSESIRVGSQKLDCFVIELSAAGGKHQLWIDKERFLVMRHKEHSVVKMDGREGMYESTLQWEIADLRFQPEANFFTFQPPSGATEVAALNLPGEHTIEAGKKAADFLLRDLQGSDVRLRDLHGKIVVLDFWATWCPPCRKELPEVVKLYEQYRDQDVAVFGISDESSGIVKKYLSGNKFTLPVLVDEHKSVGRMYGAHAIPTLVVIDREGIIRVHKVGGQSANELRAALKEAGLKE